MNEIPCKHGFILSRQVAWGSRKKKDFEILTNIKKIIVVIMTL